MAGTETTTHLPPPDSKAEHGVSGDGATDDRADGLTGVRRGALLGRYTVLEAIGSGGMGNVFAAWDPELRRRVAIKVLHADLMRSESRQRAQTRLRREARAAAQLAHPNVVAIYDVGTVGEQLFLAMELVEGQTLDTWGKTPRPWREILEVYRQAGQGLAAAHRAGLVHRDFKPSNVMLADDGQVKVLDFGLAKAVRSAPMDPAASATESDDLASEETLSIGRTTGRGVQGTPRYMSPEQRLGRPVDHRSDQFSFCLVLYRALYGQLPYSGDPAEYQEQLLAGRVAEPPADSQVPARIHRALTRGLRPEPEDRYPSLDALLDTLRPDTSSTRRGLLVAALLAAVLGGVFALRPAADPCEAAGGRLDETWSDARQTPLATVFETAGAGPTWPQVRAGLDDHTTRLRSMMVETCEATHIRREQSVDLFDRRMTCLDERHRGVEALLRLFEQGRPEVLATATTAVDGLPSLAACADRRALADLPPPPADVSEAVDKVRGHLADALALELSGQYAEASKPLETALAQAEAIGYRPLLGDVLLQRARVAGRLGDSLAMKNTLIEAVSIALATHHRELVAQAYLQLMVVGFLRGEVEDALANGQLAEAAISTLTGRQDLEAERLFFLGMISIREARFEDAVRQYEQYLALDNLSPLQRITALGNTAHSLRALGKLDQARETLEEAIPLIDDLHPQHEAGTATLINLGEIHLAAGDLEAAEAHLLPALERLEEVLGAGHPKIGNHLQLLGKLHLEAGRLDQAIAAFEEANALHEATPGYDLQPVERQWLLGRALWQQGDTDASRAWIRRAAAATDAPGEQETVAAATAWLDEHGG